MHPPTRIAPIDHVWHTAMVHNIPIVEATQMHQLSGYPSGTNSSPVRRTEITDGETVGVVFEPDAGSDHLAVMLGGSSGGIPEAPANRLAENGVCAFALGYFGAPGLPSSLVEIPIEALQRGMDWFSERYAGGRAVGLMGAELALVLGAQLGATISRVVAVAPSHVVWFGLKPLGPDPDRRSTQSSWSLGGVPLPFLPCPPDVMPAFSEKGLRIDAFHDPSRYQPADVDTARIAVERSAGPILLLSGDDDHMWPAAPMADEIVRRMEDHGRGADVTSVVYPGAGHIFLIQDFMPPPKLGAAPLYDFGGGAEADLLAGRDAWRRAVSFLQASGAPPS
jgi:acetyl esterase/lipase